MFVKRVTSWFSSGFHALCATTRHQGTEGNMRLPLFTLLALSVCTAFPTDATAKGETIYAQQCAACHGKNGEGMQYVAPQLRDATFIKTASLDEIKAVIRAGRAGADKKHPSFPSVMPPFPNLSVEDIAAVAEYIKGPLQEE